MRSNLTIKDHHGEARLFQRRCIAGAIIVGLFLLAILSRLVYLQIVEHHFYATLSRQNILSVEPITPARGLIYDRNGVLLAKNIPVYSLEIIQGRTHHLKATIQALSQYIQLTPQQKQQFFHSLKEYRPFQPVPLKLKLTPLEVAQFYVHRYRFPGAIIRTQLLRYYPLGKVTSNVVGYVGRINPKELQQINNQNYNASSYIGKVGIEKYYEQTLHGKFGYAVAEINASGRTVRSVNHIDPTPGATIYLTIDSKLQAFEEKALGKNAGAIVAIQPNTGEVLALVTKPDYDPNPFVTGISQQAYENLVHQKNHPLYNRAIRGLFSPGSTIKPFFALAGLEEKIITPSYTIQDKGWFRLPNTKHIYHDWKATGHGLVNVTKALMVSCDTYFYQLAVKMGIQRMDATLTRFGFGQLTGIDMDEELAGNVPTPEWMLSVKGHPWYTGDTIITGIGQGSLLVTPLQLATATATLAERGQRHMPHLLLNTIYPDEQPIQTSSIPEPPIVLDNKNNWQVVTRGMEAVIRNPQGTADEFGRNPNYTVAAKTGTAQVFGTYRNEERNRTDIPKHLRNNHLFIMYAPVKHPKIALAVVIEHASQADHIAREVTDFYFKELKDTKEQHAGTKDSR